MDPATISAVASAIIAAEPTLEKMIKSIVASFSEQHGLDAVEIVRQITPDKHGEIDSTVDAEIEAHTWPKT